MKCVHNSYVLVLFVGSIMTLLCKTITFILPFLSTEEYDSPEGKITSSQDGGFVITYDSCEFHTLPDYTTQ